MWKLGHLEILWFAATESSIRVYEPSPERYFLPTLYFSSAACSLASKRCTISMQNRVIQTAAVENWWNPLITKCSAVLFGSYSRVGRMMKWFRGMLHGRNRFNYFIRWPKKMLYGFNTIRTGVGNVRFLATLTLVFLQDTEGCSEDEESSEESETEVGTRHQRVAIIGEVRRDGGLCSAFRSIPSSWRSNALSLFEY